MKVKEQVAAPANAAGSGSVAGIGVGSQGEPGVYPKKKLRQVILTKTPLKRLTPIK
jgi:hypothetical protein